MIENKADQQNRLRNKELEQRLEHTQLANGELRKIIEQLENSISSLKEDANRFATDKSDVERDLDNQRKVEHDLKTRSDDLEK